ncbi:hypothetical protein BO86DRAFT_143901 [Aspergillus japonicus CBS 114.51]|uniref:Uncharacterized protein n=1 Tax=Aspergillus japonicus CBS 114.51 TaxID=1448312 RepID=A0A8T8WVQ1_ASPJA|nr:hypothetical protein BO86DRAFT_143901 [Aspergillus japonicus CBS 114.51]RAH79928.1 hypothetical protein BO86DRAFT_143901 [Aspergillus japonicus CBS 114.51]
MKQRASILRNHQNPRTTSSSKLERSQASPMSRSENFVSPCPGSKSRKWDIRICDPGARLATPGLCRY